MPQGQEIGEIKPENDEGVHSVMICPCCETSHMKQHRFLMYVELTLEDTGYVWVSYWKCVSCGCEEPDY